MRENGKNVWWERGWENLIKKVIISKTKFINLMELDLI